MLQKFHLITEELYNIYFIAPFHLENLPFRRIVIWNEFLPYSVFGKFWMLKRSEAQEIANGCENLVNEILWPLYLRTYGH